VALAKPMFPLKQRDRHSQIFSRSLFCPTRFNWFDGFSRADHRLHA